MPFELKQWLAQMEVMETLQALLQHNNTNLTGGSSMHPEVYQDIIDEFRSTLFTHHEPGSIVLICLYVPVFLLAFLGNLLVLLVVLPNRKMRSVTNCFIVNMAVSDLLVTMLCTPMAIGQSVYRFWVYGEFMCKITNYMQGVAVVSSVLTIMALSVDRYLAIRHPMTFRAFSAGHHAWKVVLVIWLFAFSTMIPLILVRQLQSVDVIPSELYYFCHEIWTKLLHRQIYDGLLFIFLFIMPGCFVTASYCRIGCQLWTEGHTLYRTDSAHGKLQAERVMSGRRRVARMLIVLAILFALCWMPYHLLNLYIDLQTRAQHSALDALPFTILLGHSNSALNPILYCFMNKSFRKCALKIICRKKKTKHKQETPVNVVVCYSKVNGSSKAPAHYRGRPLLRGSSRSTSSRSTSGSLKFSRSSGSWRCMSKSTNTSSSLRQNIAMKTVVRTVDAAHSSIESDVYMTPSDSSSPNSPTWKHMDPADDSSTCSTGKCSARKRREIFNYTLSIPTTINEESRSLSRTPTPSIERGGMLQTLVEEHSKEKHTECTPSNHDGDELTDTEDSGQGSFAMEDPVGAPLLLLPQSHGLLPTVIVTTDDITGSSSSSSAAYEEAIRNLFAEAHQDIPFVPSAHDNHPQQPDLQRMLVGERMTPVRVVVTDTAGENA